MPETLKKMFGTKFGTQTDSNTLEVYAFHFYSSYKVNPLSASVALI